MNDKPYTKIGNTYYPKEPQTEISESEIKGSYWRAWSEGEKYFYEFDEGHFASKFRTVEISCDDYQLLKSGKITDSDLTLKYKVKSNHE
ncbi:hypothetical protein [Solemya pervernicosa gill symbiont]|uniref:hypothetical protein n=1 Tax=Solemya pervernicosa gill symbiont TaxID=642797 RepID=UPI0010847713|nr:hypothetical protein [Solemya pervernicosa gill symbiont]